MKRIVLPFISIYFVVVSFAISNLLNLKINRSCVWFLYDNPSIDNPLLDYPSNLTEAITINNYTPATYFEVSELCNQVRKLCAICAEVDINGYPRLGPNEYIVIFQIEPYFRISDETYRIPNPNLIREKFTY